MKNRVAQSAIPRTVPLPVLLGLSDPPEVDWNPIRVAQFRCLHEKAAVKLVGSLTCGLMAIQTFLKSLDGIAMIVWAVAFTLFQIGMYVHSRRRLELPGKRVTNREFVEVVALAAVSGAFWAVALIFMGEGSSPTSPGSLAIIAMVLCLMIGSAMIASSVPLGSFAFIVTCGVGLVAIWPVGEDFRMPLGFTGITALLVLAALTHARSFVDARVAEANLFDKQETVSLLLREFEDSGADWLWQTDTSRRLVHVTPRLARAVGVPVDELEGMPILKLLAGESWESGAFTPVLHELAERMKHRDSFSNLMVPVELKDGPRWWEVSASPKTDEKGVFLGFRGVGSDVTEQRTSADKISRMARFDTLTGLPNRLMLTETLVKAMAEADKWNSRCGLMMLDLDRFKAVNDTLGHPVGDRLLAQVSERLRGIMSDNELCGRLGGDEFAIVVHDASDSTYMERLGERIIEKLSAPYLIDQHTLYIGASVGTGIAPRDGRTAEMLMRSADLALYRSKDEGGGAHNEYEPKLHVHAEERRVMEIALRKALGNDEFSLNYQPVVNADSGAVMGFEALLRWTNPDFGVVSPAKFIPIAEDARLIVPIGEWVMRAACAEAATWPAPIKIAVNVSADQLTDPGFLDMVVAALDDSGLIPQRLEIEVTESIFLRDGGGAARVLDEIIALGINLSLDDFGTGYSSLGYLRKTRFSTIKVDRSFVQGAAKNAPESLAIIRAVVAMADSLGMSTTAEGTETEEEVRMIQRLGCKKIQGYFFGRPMSAHNARELFINAASPAGQPIVAPTRNRAA